MARPSLLLYVQVQCSKSCSRRLPNVGIQNSRWRWVIIGLVFAVAIIGGLLSTLKPSSNVALTDLNTIEELRARFNEDKGKIRILLLMSPT